MFVYLLSCEKKTYIGSTVNLQRRLRQHNGEITGGAKYTRGGTWEMVCYVKGFPTWKAALQFEWRWKRFRSRGVPNKVASLDKLLQLDRPTKNSVPFLEWDRTPLVVFLKDLGSTLYLKMSILFYPKIIISTPNNNMEMFTKEFHMMKRCILDNAEFPSFEVLKTHLNVSEARKQCVEWLELNSHNMYAKNDIGFALDNLIEHLK